MTAPSRREQAAALAVLALIVAVVLGPHVARGGFLSDDWENAATTAHPPDEGFLGPFDLGLGVWRPVLAALLPLPHLAFGSRPAPHLALGLALAVLAAATFFLVLRAAGLGRRGALVAAALALLFPFSASTRLWATASLNSFALIAFGAGVLLALRSLAAPDPRARRLRRGALALQAAGLLTYETVAALHLGTLPLYVRAAGNRRAGLALWRSQALLAGAVLAWGAAVTSHERHGPAVALRHGLDLVAGGASLLGRAAVPGLGEGPGALVGALLVVALGLGLHRARGVVRDRLLVAAVGLGVALVSWIPLVPADPAYHPLAPGLNNRVNLVAGFGLALAVSGAALALSAAGARRLAAAALAVVGVAWAVELRREAERFERVTSLAERGLVRAQRALDRPGAPQVLYVTGAPRWGAEDVPAFAYSWDLNAAVKLGDPSRAAFPLGLEAGRLRCEAYGLGPAPTIDRFTEPVAYGQAGLLDLRTGRLSRLSRRADCELARAVAR